ncbi:MAG TPA: hypothetical protein VLV83_16110 [Acidobacteriota bacterium]|nr:hypothetical protein [Acidobacteriota bacterium]
MLDSHRGHRAMWTGGWEAGSKTPNHSEERLHAVCSEERYFEVIFQKGELDGRGQISDFLLIGKVVSTVS